MSSGSGITPAQPGSLRPSSPPGQVVQIVSLPDGLQNAARAMRLEGEVIALNKDGTVTVRTSEGPIDLTVKGRQPQQGARVEIDIPPGNPPRQAQMRPAPAQPAPRPAPEQPAQPAPQQAPPATTAPPVQTQPAPPPQTGGTTQPSQPLPATPPAQGQPPALPTQGQTPSVPPQAAPSLERPQPPLPSSYQPPAPNGKTPTPQSVPPLAAGQSVRLAPYPPSLAQSAIQQGIAPPMTPDSLIGTQIMRAAFQAGLIVSGAQSELQKTLIQVMRPAAAGIPAPLSTSPSTPQNSGITQVSSPPFPINSALQGSGQLQSILQTQSLFPSLTGMVGKTENGMTDSGAAPRLFQLDGKIIAVRPNVLMVPPHMDSAEQNGVFQSTAARPAKSGDVFKMSSQGPIDSRPAILTAIVTGFTPQNMPMVSIRWPGGQVSQNFILQYPAGNLTQGTQILLQPQGQAVLPSPGGAAFPAAGAFSSFRPAWPLMSASPLWPALDDIYQTLLHTSPQLAQMMARVMPSPSAPAQLGPAALLFIAAIRTGNLDGWLGERKMDSLLRAEKSSFLSRLSGDAGNALSANADSQSGEWRSYPIPMLWQNEISKIMLHMRHEREARDGDEENGGARFVMDVSLTRMGEVQLDGLVRGKRLDLVVRTELPVSHTMQQAMRKAYADALANTDIYGEIGFQSDIKGWMKIMRRDDTVAVNI